MAPTIELAQPSPPRTDNRAHATAVRRAASATRLLQTTGINVIYGLANLARGQATARITPKTWWANMENGWVWDLDDFVVNQIGHPYQGSNYYNAGRANGLSFYESAAMAAFGSATWEYYGETNHASLNDFINTTLGGIAIGEVLHRAAWLIRDPRASGRGRLWREIGATIVDPMTGYQPLHHRRCVDGGRQAGGDGARRPLGTMAVGRRAVARHGGAGRELVGRAVRGSWTCSTATSKAAAAARPTTRSRCACGLAAASPISDAKIRGRLIGQPLRGGTLQFIGGAVLRLPGQRRLQLRRAVVRGHHRTCTQRVLAALRAAAASARAASRCSARSTRCRQESIEAPDEEVDPDAPQGVSEGPRNYDYGPGSNFSGAAVLTRDRDIVAAFLYEGRHLYSLDGVRANHFLQHIRADLKWPLRGPLGIGASGEYFSRHTYFQDAARTEARVLVSAVSRLPDVESPMRRETTICAWCRIADPVVAGDRRRADGGGRCRAHLHRERGW